MVKFFIDRGKNLELFDVLEWTIWYKRNLLHTLDKSFPITQVLPNAVSSHADFLRTFPNDLPALNPLISSRAMWIPPPHLMFKVNFDGAVFKEENKASIGVVIQDDLGQVMALMFENISLPSSVDEVETLATVRALNFSHEVVYSSIILECDLESYKFLEK